ncbi:hypothetical protein BGZ65_006539, partial [Modicella reniformis]
MSSTSTVTASYNVASSTSSDAPESTAATSGSLSFKVHIILPSEEETAASLSVQATKESYLAALAKALSNLQESINAGLTERLVQQGVLSETTDQDPNMNTKLRTKVPGQPNNSKKAQTKQQQQRQREQKQKGQDQESSAAETEAKTEDNTEEGATVLEGTTS